MTTVVVQHAWADGSITSVQVDLENDYPDALDQARVTAVRAPTEAVTAIASDE